MEDITRSGPYIGGVSLAEVTDTKAISFLTGIRAMTSLDSLPTWKGKERKELQMGKGRNLDIPRVYTCVTSFRFLCFTKSVS